MLLRSSPTFPEDIAPLQPNRRVVKRKATAGIPEVCKINDPIRLIPAMKNLAESLMKDFKDLFNETYPSGCHMQPKTLFKVKDAWQLVKNYDAVLNGVFLREILGGQRLPGHFDKLTRCIQEWIRSECFQNHQEALEDLQIENDQDLLNLELVEDHHREQSRLKLAEKASKDSAIAARKQIRQEKSVAAKMLKAEKREHRQREAERRQEEACEKAQAKATAKAMKDAANAVKQAGISERRRVREEKKQAESIQQG